MARTSPTGRRRHLARELRHLREATGQTADQVAKQLGWTPSTLTHIERNDWKLPKLNHVEALLDAYGVTEPGRRAELLEFAHQGRGHGWWETYKQLTEPASTFIGLEYEAVSLRCVAPLRLPGILHHPDYARALHRNPDNAAAAAEIVGRRQAILTGDDPLDVWVIVGEGVLRQQVGGHRVHAAQLDHLVRLAHLPNVRVFIHPFTAPRLLPAEFVHLAFRDVVDPEAVYTPSAGGGTWCEDPAQVTPYTDAFEDLLGSALPRAQSQRFIATLGWLTG